MVLPFNVMRNKKSPQIWVKGEKVMSLSWDMLYFGCMWTIQTEKSRRLYVCIKLEETSRLEIKQSYKSHQSNGIWNCGLDDHSGKVCRRRTEESQGQNNDQSPHYKRWSRLRRKSRNIKYHRNSREEGTWKRKEWSIVLGDVESTPPSQKKKITVLRSTHWI